MKNILSKISKTPMLKNSNGIVHLGVAALLGAMLVGAAVIIYVNRDGSSVRENLTDREEIDNEQDDSDVKDEEDNDDEDSGAYHVVFDDDSIKGTQGESQPLTIEVGISNAWAQTCNGLYGGWKGKADNSWILTTDAGKDDRSGEGDFGFAISKGDGKLSADKSTITIKHQVNCIYCEDPWMILTGKVIKGQKVPCK